MSFILIYFAQWSKRLHGLIDISKNYSLQAKCFCVRKTVSALTMKHRYLYLIWLLFSIWKYSGLSNKNKIKGLQSVKLQTDKDINFQFLCTSIIKTSFWKLAAFYLIHQVNLQVSPHCEEWEGYHDN